MNLLIKTQYVSDEVRMWVFEEVLPNGEKLTDVINKTNVRNMDDAVLYLFIYSYFLGLLIRKMLITFPGLS